MQPIRYIHAADLHLDRPFSGMSVVDARLLERLRESSFQAMKRLGNLCEAEKPDFLVLAGDIYDQEEHSVKAQLALLDLCEKMALLKIPVFIVHGNHDPLSSVIHSLTWPDNVTIFGENYFAAPVCRNGEPIALIHGISHAHAPEDRNLAALFQRVPDFDGFQLGVLHCSLAGAQGEGVYAPCSLDDLLQSRLDAWALGHSHERRILSQFPFIAYSGSSQGFHINESGPRGCLMVECQKEDSAWKCDGQFRQLASIQWLKVELDITDISAPDVLEDNIFAELEKIGEGTGPGVKDVFVRIVFTGRTALHAQLRLSSAQNDLKDRLVVLEKRNPAIHIKDFRMATKPPLASPLADQQDLPGEIWRIADQLEEDPEKLRAFANQAMNPLFSNALARKYLQLFDVEEQKELLRQAKFICLEHLESK